MNWTKTPPTRPGAYWIRHAPPHTTGVGLVNIVRISTGALVEDEGRLNVSYYGNREWCGPLVPVEEVEKAYFEGVDDCRINDTNLKVHKWQGSRARCVVEGKEI